MRIPHASRDVFLDNITEQSFIEDQLRALEKIARKNGRAVAIPSAPSQRWNARVEKFIVVFILFSGTRGETRGFFGCPE